MDDAARTALEGLRLIDLLAESEPAQWFLGEIRKKADALAVRILDEDMPAAEREELRQQRKALKEVLRLPAELMAGMESNLRTAGVKRGSVIPK